MQAISIEVYGQLQPSWHLHLMLGEAQKRGITPAVWLAASGAIAVEPCPASPHTAA